MKPASNSFQVPMCRGIEKNYLAKQQAFTIYRKFTSRPKLGCKNVSGLSCLKYQHANAMAIDKVVEPASTCTVIIPVIVASP